MPKPTYKELETRLVKAEKKIKDLEKRSEIKLTESYDLVQSLMKATTDAVVILDREGIILDMNWKYASRFGKTIKEFKGSVVWDLFDRKIASVRKKIVDKVFKSGKMIRTLDERSGIWNDYSVYPIKNIEGKTNRVAVFAHDITEFKKAEQALKVSQALYKSTVESVQEYIHSVDRNLEVKLINGAFKKWCRKLGLKSPLVGKSIKDNFPFLPAKVYKEYQQIFKNGKSIRSQDNFEINGRIIYTETEKFPVVENDEVVRVVTVIRDITKQRKSEQALIESETRFRELFNHMSSGVAVYKAVDNGKDFVFVDFNPAAEIIEKVKKKELIGKKVTEVFPSVKKFGVFKTFQRVWKTGKSEYFPPAVYQDSRLGSTWRESWVYKLPSGEIIAVYDEVTERIQYQENLKKFEQIINANPDPMSFLDDKFRYVTINDAYVKLFKKSRQQIIGKTASSLVGRDRYEKIVKPQHDRCLKGEIVNFQNWFKTSKHDKTFFDVHYIPLIVDGKVKGIITCTRDITELKKMEQELRERERLLDFAIQQMPVPVIIAEAPEVNITHINQPAKDLMEKIDTEISKISLENHREYWATFHPDGTPYKVEDLPLTEAIKKGKITKNKEIIVRHSDRDHWISASAAPLLNEKGKIIAGIVVFPEITIQKRLEQALKKSEEHFRFLADNSTDLVTLHDADGIFVYLSPFCVNLLDYNVEELHGKNPYDYLYPADIPVVAKKHEEVIKEKQVISFEYRFRKKDGSYIWLESTSKIIENRHGEQQIIVSSRDITQRKEFEEELEQYRNSLEFIVKERTAEIQKANEELKQHRDKLEKLVLERTEDLRSKNLDLNDALQKKEISETNLRKMALLLMGASDKERRKLAMELHDNIGQILAAININFELLKKEVENNEEEQTANQIDKLSGQIDILAEQVRNITRGLHPIMLNDLGLIPAIKKHCDDFLFAKKITYKIDSNCSERRFARRIEEAFFRIIQEALTNVVRHSKATEVDIIFKFNEKEDFLQVSVKDNGEGYDQKIYDEHIRESWGIFNMRERATAVGAEFDIKSIPGQGTEVKVVLKLET